MNKCGNCRHWKEIFNTEAPCNSGSPRQGECKQQPPLAMVMLKENENGHQEPDGMFCYYPTMPPDYDACSQYSPQSNPDAVIVSAMVFSRPSV